MLAKHQRSFITRLFQGTLERRIELDFIINQFSKTPVNKMKPVIREILRMGVYQIKYMDNVPVSAVCNEGVKLAEKRKFRNLKGFVNGVLRNVARNIEKIEYPKEQKERLSVIYSVPKWIIEKWTKEYGISKTEEMLEGLYKPKATSVRCNTSKATVEEIVKSLEYQGTTVEKSKLYDKALKISGYDKLENLDVFKAGMVTVQDESSMMENYLLPERNIELAAEGKRWYDMIRYAKSKNYAHKSAFIALVQQYNTTANASWIRSVLQNEYAWYLPIHADEIENNTLLVQNPYYGITGNN